MASTDAGIFGDILCARMAKRNSRGPESPTGWWRDMEGVLATCLPVCWCGRPRRRRPRWRGSLSVQLAGGLSPAVAWRSSPETPLSLTATGAVVIPAGPMLAEVTDMAARNRKRREAWIMAKWKKARPLPGLYPAQ